jgi:hypothetical protein
MNLKVVNAMTKPTKTTSITIRFNNGEIQEGIEVLKAFCAAVLNQDVMPTMNPIADAMLNAWTGKGVKL